MAGIIDYVSVQFLSIVFYNTCKFFLVVSVRSKFCSTAKTLIKLKYKLLLIFLTKWLQVLQFTRNHWGVAYYKVE